MAWTREQWMVVFRVFMLFAKMVAFRYCLDFVNSFHRIPMLYFHCVENQQNLRSGIVVPVLGYIVRLLVAHWTASFASSIVEHGHNLAPLIELRFPDELLQLRIAIFNFFRYLDQFLMPRRNLYRQG